VCEGASTPARTALQLLWATLLVQVLGRLIDARWHATHDEFEGASEQLEAHWLAWIGVLATLGVAAWAAQRGVTPGRLGYLTVLVATGFYVPVAVWHFIEHANHSDPELAHVLLAISQIAVLVGAIAATLAWRSPPRGETGPAEASGAT
jgi:hypothetical protein